MNELKIQQSEYSYEAYAIFEQAEERDAFIAKFPKSLKLWATTLYDDGNYLPIARFQVVLQATATTGEVNETGLKRLAKFQELLEKVGA